MHVSHVFREANQVVDCLAKSGCQSTDLLQVFHSMSSSSKQYKGLIPLNKPDLALGSFVILLFLYLVYEIVLFLRLWLLFYQ